MFLQLIAVVKEANNKSVLKIKVISFDFLIVSQLKLKVPAISLIYRVVIYLKAYNANLQFWTCKQYFIFIVFALFV